MEWVETTGASVEEAKERALRDLGVAERDAEFIVLEEPKSGLFGRVKGEARVRARVRPAQVRPKRARSRREGGGQGRQGNRPQRPRNEGGESANTERRNGGGQGRNRNNRPAQNRGGKNGSTAKKAIGQEETMSDGVTLQQQADAAKTFLEGLAQRYGFDVAIEVRELDEETVELAVTGDNLGLLVGPKGATLAALQDMTRTVVQRHFPGHTDRILVDVAGYRERRIAALRRFSEQVAQEVLASGSEQALESMSAADRKVVHDTIAGIDGVVSRSEGDDPRRHVVVSPQ